MGKYRSLGAGFDKTFRNDLNANFDDVDIDIKSVDTKTNKATTTANEALSKAATADTKAVDAKKHAERLETELGQAILEGDSNPLGGQLSVGADGTVYSGGPQERLVKEHQQVMTDLAHKAEQKVVDTLYTQRNNNDIYTPNGNVTPKLIYNSGGYIYVITQKPHGKGYVRFRLQDGVVMSASSHGGSADLIRITQVYEVLDCYLVKFNEIATSDPSLWSTSQISDRGVMVNFRNMSYTVAVAGAWIEYEVTVPDGVYSIQTTVRSSNTTSTDVDISVDGEIIQSGVSFKKGETGNVHRINTPITPGTHTIRFTNNLNGGSMTIAGTSCVDLKDYKNGYDHDARVVIHTSTNPYIYNQGATDYALIDENGLYFGSYHGGEVRNRLQYTLDGEVISLVDGKFVVGKVFEVEQDTLLINKLNSYTRQIFRLDGAREMETVFDGDVNVKSVNTNMTTASDAFNEVVYPRRVNVGTNGQWVLPENCNYVVQRNPNTNQKIVTITNNATLTEEPTIPFILVIPGSYCKLYKRNYYNLDNPAINFKKGTFRTVHIFE